MTRDSCGLDEYSERQEHARNGFALQHPSNVARARGPHPPGSSSIRNSLRVAVVIRARCSSFRRASLIPPLTHCLEGNMAKKAKKAKTAKKKKKAKKK